MKWEPAKSSSGPGKKGKGRGLLIAIVVIVAIVVVGGISRCGGGEKDEPKQLNWPTEGLATMLPDPKTDKGEVIIDSADSLSVHLDGYSVDDFNDYVSACKEKGFTVDYSSSSTSYSASTEEGYSLMLFYSENNEELSVSLNAPAEEEPASDEAESETPAETPEPEATPEPEPAPEPEAPAEPEPTSGATSGSADFRAMVDEYEAFMNEYCDFMENYNSDSGNVVSMALDYASMMSRYGEWAEKIDAIDESTLSAEDDLYFLDAQTRINQRLLSIGLS